LGTKPVCFGKAVTDKKNGNCEFEGVEKEDYLEYNEGVVL
jgi:hypothetical protein